MKEKIFIISDVEMGRSDIMDDFTSDGQLADFIVNIQKENRGLRLTLVLNGDIFDFLKMAYKSAYPRHITEEISAWKLEEVFKNHPRVFSALKEFLGNRGNCIFFIIGNHDPDLAWPALQNRLRKYLKGSAASVKFDFWFEKNGIHAEHGHLYDPFFSIKTSKPLLKFKGREILNMPWGANICFSYLVDLKKNFPREEQIFPKHLIFSINPALKKQTKKLAREIILKDFLVNPIIKFRDPTYRIPYLKIISHFLRYGTEVIDDSVLLPRYLKLMTKKYPGRKIYAMGHSHLLVKKILKDKKIFVTDTWRDEYNLEQNMEKKKKSFLEISLHDGLIAAAQLKEL